MLKKHIKILLFASREKVVIPETLPFVTFLGNANDRPTISGNDTSSVTRSDGTRLKTFNSATVAVNASYFIAINIVFEVIKRLINLIILLHFMFLVIVHDIDIIWK